MALSPSQKKLHRAKMGNLWRDVVIVVFGIVITLLLVRMGALQELLTIKQEYAYIGSFIAGIFFTSVFTIAPASIVLAAMTHVEAPLTVALWAALGAMLGDLVLFLFIRDVFAEDMESVVQVRKWKKILARPHLGFLRWLLPLIGALIIASPLPDELGIALLGFSKTRTYLLMPIAFAMNFIGVLVLAFAAAQIG
jgi:uncharacterized membrane protein YdjX (TVP38/TMEM64 family)